MPAIKLCGLSPYHNIGNPSCLFRDIGNRMHNQTCDIFKVPPDPSDPIDLPCYVFNSKGLFATKVASFSSGFEIAIELISVTPSGGAERPYNPFTDSNALTGYVYEPLTMTSGTYCSCPCSLSVWLQEGHFCSLLVLVLLLLLLLLLVLLDCCCCFYCWRLSLRLFYWC